MLKIEGLSFSAPEGGRKIIRNIDLEIPTGKLIALTGPNGGGKTTLAKLIAGVEKPDSGRILLDGTDLVPLDPTERARLGVSYAFQQPVRFKGISVRDLLTLANGAPMNDEEISAVLQRVGLQAGAYIDRDVDSHLSGGEIKRIEIASVILRKAKLAVFDEPEAGIDLWSFNNLIRVFEMMKEERSCTLIVISHQERILSIADEIVMIQDGRIGLHGGRDRIFPNLLCKNDCDNCAGRAAV